MKYLLEYIWLDANDNLRSKIKVLNNLNNLDYNLDYINLNKNCFVEKFLL